MSNGIQAATSGTSIVQVQRRTEMLQLRVAGMTLEQVGERMGVTKEAVRTVINRALATLVKEPTEQVRALELERCDKLLAEAMATVNAFHPLVSAGRVVSAPLLDSQGQPVRNPETREVLTRVLEDKAPKLAAIAVAIRVMKRRAELLGLDAPMKTQQEVTVFDTTKGQDLSHVSLADLEHIKATLYLPANCDCLDVTSKEIQDENN